MDPNLLFHCRRLRLAAARRFIVEPKQAQQRITTTSKTANATNSTYPSDNGPTPGRSYHISSPPGAGSTCSIVETMAEALLEPAVALAVPAVVGAAIVVRPVHGGTTRRSQ